MIKKLSRSEAGRLGSEKSKIIQAQQKAKRVSIYNSNPTFCAYCEMPMSYEKRKNKFCNNSCAASLNGLGKVRNGSPAGNCIQCGKKLPDTFRKYCSHRCHKNYQWQMKVEQIKNGKIVYNSTLRKFMLETHGHKCTICLNTNWMGKIIPLDLDHIDGDPYNNFPNNLRLLCPNCHAQTDTYKGKNIGSGRHKRRLRYTQDKSY